MGEFTLSIQTSSFNQSHYNFKRADYWERLIMFRHSIHNSLWKYKKEAPSCKIKLGMEKVEQNADKI